MTETEHDRCLRVAEYLYELARTSEHPVQEIKESLFTERKAAREQGRIEAFAESERNAAEELRLAREQGRAEGNKEADEEWSPQVEQLSANLTHFQMELAALQSKHERVVAAARAYREGPPTLGDSKGKALDAALANEPSAQPSDVEQRLARVVAAARAVLDNYGLWEPSLQTVPALRAALAGEPETEEKNK